MPLQIVRFPPRADCYTQTVLQHRMPAIQIFDQYTAPLQAIEHCVAFATRNNKKSPRWVNLHGGGFSQLPMQPCTIQLDLLRLQQQRIVVLQQLPGTSCGKTPTLYGKRNFSNCPSHAVLRPKNLTASCHAELGKCAHYQQIRITRQAPAKNCHWQSIIGFVHHHQSGDASIICATASAGNRLQ